MLFSWIPPMLSCSLFLNGYFLALFDIPVTGITRVCGHVAIVAAHTDRHQDLITLFNQGLSLLFAKAGWDKLFLLTDIFTLNELGYAQVGYIAVAVYTVNLFNNMKFMREDDIAWR